MISNYNYAYTYIIFIYLYSIHIYIYNIVYIDSSYVFSPAFFPSPFLIHRVSSPSFGNLCLLLNPYNAWLRASIHWQVEFLPLHYSDIESLSPASISKTSYIESTQIIQDSLPVLTPAYFLLYLFGVRACSMACRILVPQPETEPTT